MELGTKTDRESIVRRGRKKREEGNKRDRKEQKKSKGPGRWEEVEGEKEEVG